MKRSLILLATASLFGGELEKVSIEAEINSEIVKDVSGSEIKSADVAEALSKNIPSINLIRRSGIANDILLRGQKRDNINVIVDGTKVCGACVNRMDPPTSHILANNVDMIKVSEGPFDVENFGTLSGLVDITTKKPTSKVSGELGINVGSFGYQKWFGTISGGSDKVKVLLSASTEKGEQYEDGNGDDFYDQIANNIAKGTAPKTTQYQDKYKDVDAFLKSTLMGKVFIDITDDQELKFSYTANRSDDVLYPSSKMDAIYDDSDIYNLEYAISNIGLYSKKLEFQIYNSTVEHPMSTKYRISGKDKEKTHFLSTDMTGVKLKNSYDSIIGDLMIGLDYSLRNWDGYFTSDSQPLKMTNGMLTPPSLDDVDTTNQAIFIKGLSAITNNIDLEYGARYDYTEIESASKNEPTNDYDSLSANLFATFNVDDSLSYFAGIGNSYRVPDARELYLYMMGNHFGTPDLKESKNYEIDLGFKKIFENFSIKTKTFYSYIEDYIAYNASNMKVKKDGTKGAFHSFENVDAIIYGAEISGDWLLSDDLYINYALNYKRGEKSDPLTNQTGTDLPDMRPLKAIVGLNYDSSYGGAKLEFIGASGWDDIDNENGEQELAGYGVVNLKADHTFSKNITLTLGIDNILDKTYAITNTYRDLTLLTANAKVDDVMLLNEPGRYLYANLKWEF